MSNRQQAFCVSAETCVTEAEEACLAKIAEITGLRPGVDAFIGANRKGVIDCAVFDIGHLDIGDQTAFPAYKYCFRATLNLFNRSRRELQRWVGRLLVSLPIGPWQGRTNELESTTNVECLRIAPETDAVGDIGIAAMNLDAQGGRGGPEAYNCELLLDVVFSAVERPQKSER